MSSKNKNKDTHDYQKIEIVASEDDKLAVSEQALLPILMSAEVLTKVDTETVIPKHLNSFNFVKLASVFRDGKKSIGITSARINDGKTRVVANMAVSLASAYRQKTLVIDMNFQRPKLHTIFGTNLAPGLAEALVHQKLRVVPTSIHNLYLMTAGNSEDLKPGVEHTMLLRQILYTVKEKFDFVIIDLASIFPISDFPIHFMNEIDGFIGVIDSNNTKKGDFEKIFKYLDESQFVGYIFNRMDEP